MNAKSHKNAHQMRRSSHLKAIFTAMAMMLVVGGAVSPVMPLLETALAAAPRPVELGPNDPEVLPDQPELGIPIEIAEPIDPVLVDPQQTQPDPNQNQPQEPDQDPNGNPVGLPEKDEQNDPQQDPVEEPEAPVNEPQDPPQNPAEEPQNPPQDPVEEPENSPQDPVDNPEEPGQDPIQPLDSPEDTDDGETAPPDTEQQQVEFEEYLLVELNWCPEGTDLSMYPDAGEGPGSLCSEAGHDATVVLESITSPANNASIPVPAATGYAEFRPIPVDSWELHIESTVPLTDESLHCASFNELGNTKPYGHALFALTSVPTWETYSLETNDDEYTYCFWYGVPGAEEIDETGDLTLTKYECPTTPDPTELFTWYIDNCTSMDGVMFTLDMPDPQPDISTATNDTGTPGYIQMLGVEPGTYPLVETVPAGYMPLALFCRELNRDVSVLITPTEVALSGNSATVTINPDKVLQCFWFNVSTDADNGPGDIKLMKYECNMTPDPTATYEWYRDNCVTTMDGVMFTLDKPDPDPDISTATNDTGTSGYIQMLGVEPGTYPLVETVPAGYIPQALFCAVVPIDTVPVDTDYMPVMLMGNTADITITSNQLLYCKMFNLMDDNGITLRFHKFNCPPGTLAGEPEGTYISQCTTEVVDMPFEITDDSGAQNTTSVLGGRDIPNLTGEITIQEMIPTGFGEPAVYCMLEGDLATSAIPSTNGLVNLAASTDKNYECWFYNIPDPESTVIIHKWRCPDGVPAEMTQDWFETNCTTPMEVDFTLTDTKGPRILTSTGGIADWTDVATGPVQITEHIPDGFAQQPFLVCLETGPTGVLYEYFTPATVNGTWNTTITEGGSTIECDWYNWYLGPGEITVHKLTCPEGYDRTAWGADPMTECIDATNGITFTLDQPDPGVDLFSDTGDSVPGAVHFGGLEPGDYTLTEMLDPAVTMQDIFVWQCAGLETSAVHPTPLSVGSQLSFKVAAGDKIVCHWFNVPYPELGWMDVHKFNCTTETYVKDVYCYTNQTGQEFSLQIWDGSNWVTLQTGVTDVSGKLTFSDLDAGAYRLVEQGAEACLMKSSNITASGNLGVALGEGTTVHVYNCKTQPPPQKTPTKYPNTGVDSAGKGDINWTPGLGITGMIGLLGAQFTRRRMVAGAGMAAASTLPLAMAQQIVPLSGDSTPVPGTPEPGVFWCPSPSATTPETDSTPMVDPCNRGAIPIQMRIPVIDVDAPMEYLEIIDGAMQQPTGDTHITWYKETSRLGEVGNGIYAAHVNWYGNPEGIFFRLESLQEGDVIEIDGDDQQTLLYEVQWVQNFPSNEEPPEEALGITNDVVITLITCGGEWSSALSEYDHRTLVRAVLRE